MDHWFAGLYDQEETGTQDIALLLDFLGPIPQNILEACCGTGRILIPLSQAGHTVTGFDADEAMLERLSIKAQGTPCLSYMKMDAFSGDWGQDYDAVVLAGNILINIKTQIPYRQAQETFIEKAAGCLRTGGRLFLDFDLHERPQDVFTLHKERVIFEGTDDQGVNGKYSLLDGVYDPDTRLCHTKGRAELILQSGERITKNMDSLKYIPTLNEVVQWLDVNRLSIVADYGAFDKRPIGPDTHRAILCAKKRK
jgi:SAM-dependent methyltransferase